MKQFLNDFFSDDTVCLGICDLKRKIAKASLTQQVTTVNYANLQNYSEPVKPTQQTYATVQQKPQKQTLAQKFAAQQQAYAAQQAYIEQQRQRFAAVQQNFQATQQQYQQTIQQKQVYTEAKPVYVNKNPYYSQTSQNNYQPKVIIDGSKKKVVSAAVPARYSV
jgi:hypothetical protein